LFWFAVATDVADGRVARRYGEVSPWGRIVDHAVDATFVTTGTAALALTGALPAALSFLIALAFVQYAVDSGWAGQTAVRPSRLGAVRPSRLGHWNGIAYYVIVAVPIMRDALGLGWPGPPWVLAAGWILVATTVLSIIARLRFTLAAE
jgi:CDP-diacylglycerol--glycerol-3-phosphate 3-phosphatidyltransferase